MVRVRPADARPAGAAAGRQLRQSLRPLHAGRAVVQGGAARGGRRPAAHLRSGQPYTPLLSPLTRSLMSLGDGSIGDSTDKRVKYLI